MTPYGSGVIDTRFRHARCSTEHRARRRTCLARRSQKPRDVEVVMTSAVMASAAACAFALERRCNNRGAFSNKLGETASVRSAAHLTTTGPGRLGAPRRSTAARLRRHWM